MKIKTTKSGTLLTILFVALFTSMQAIGQVQLSSEPDDNGEEKPDDFMCFPVAKCKDH